MKARRNSGGPVTVTKEIDLSGQEETLKALEGLSFDQSFKRDPEFYPKPPVTETGFSAHDVADAHAEGFAEGRHQGWEEGGGGF